MISSAINTNDFIPFLDKSLCINVVDYSVKKFSAQGFGSTMLAVKAKVKMMKKNVLHEEEVR